MLLSLRYYFHVVVQKGKITSLCLANAISELRFWWEGKLMFLLPVVVIKQEKQFGGKQFIGTPSTNCIIL